MPDVFVTHGASDHAAAQSACALLATLGVSCRLTDTERRNRSEHADEAPQGPEGCHLVAAVQSESAKQDASVQQDVARAKALGLEVLPLDLEPGSDGASRPANASLARLVEAVARKKRLAAPLDAPQDPHATSGLQSAISASAMETVVMPPVFPDPPAIAATSPLTDPPADCGPVRIPPRPSALETMVPAPSRRPQLREVPNPPGHRLPPSLGVPARLPEAAPAPAPHGESPPQQRRVPWMTLMASFAAACVLGAAGMAGYSWWMNRTGEVAFQTSPPGAAVQVGGLSTKSPALVHGLKPGRYVADVNLAGYQPQTVEFLVEAGNRTEPPLLTLMPELGRLDVTTDPPGVALELRSITHPAVPLQAVTTPSTFQLPVGGYELTLRHRDETKRVKLVVRKFQDWPCHFVFGKPMPVVANTGLPRATLPALPVSPELLTAANPTAPSPLVALPPHGPASSDSPPEPQVAPASPPLGYWNLDELFQGSQYVAYSENGRRHVVYEVQRKLKIGADGKVGKGLHAALVKYQQAQSLVPTGRLDVATLGALGLAVMQDSTGWTPPRTATSARTSRTPESEKTWMRKIIEKNMLGGRDLKSAIRGTRGTPAAPAVPPSQPSPPPPSTTAPPATQP